MNFAKFLRTYFLQNISDDCFSQTKLEANVRLTVVLNFKRKSLSEDLEGFIAKLSVKLYPFVQLIEKNTERCCLFYACYRNGTGIKKSVQQIFIEGNFW